MKQWLQWALSVVILAQIGCNTSKKIVKAPESITVKAQNTFQDIAQATIFSDSNFAAAHVGISIYNPATQQYLYNYQGDKYFVPASNMKLFTCYAAMKNLGDSLVGLRYSDDNGNYIVQASGDPTFLHPDFKNQSVFNFIKRNQAKTFSLIKGGWFNETRLGKGWAWDDYNSDYMAERSEFPIYGNVVTVKASLDSDIVVPHIPCANVIFKAQLSNERGDRKYIYVRDQSHNILNRKSSNAVFNQQQIPFITSIDETIKFIKDTIKGLKINYDVTGVLKQNNIIHSQPTDSLLKPMMHNSDNFFAEQTLLMVSNEKLGVMSDEQIIDTLLKTDFKGLPQKPRWVDGSGLSRYNLITPQDFVWVLTKMKADFSWQRITTILPSGNQGTLNNYYKNLAGNIFAKTGTLSGQVALSGYLISKQGKTLVFSVLVNNHQTSATAIRRGVEKFLTQVYEQY